VQRSNEKKKQKQTYFTVEKKKAATWTHQGSNSGPYGPCKNAPTIKPVRQAVAVHSIEASYTVRE
jgi:hypothetical protein